jgi:hypothetical protein
MTCIKLAAAFVSPRLLCHPTTQRLFPPSTARKPGCETGNSQVVKLIKVVTLALRTAGVTDGVTYYKGSLTL